MTDTRQALAALKLAKRLCDEALPKFNWGASALDANAIRLLNEAPQAINIAIAALEAPKTRGAGRELNSGDLMAAMLRDGAGS